MAKARRRSAPIAAAIALSLGCGAPAASADPAAADWEAALQKCLPGAPFDACAAALTAAKLTLRKEDNGDHVELGFALQAPLGGYAVRTYKKAGGKVAAVRVTLIEPKGKGRKAVLTWFKQQIGTSARQGRSGGPAEGCGADGWGVGWVAGKSPDPEVELQLHSPESASDSDNPEKLKPEDALLKRAGDDGVVACFVLPTKAGSAGYVDAPAISPATLQAFLASPLFHGKAVLK
jgi:hypothetical protein